MPATKNKRPQVQHVWCPACGCDVKRLLTPDLLRRSAKVAADERKVRQALKYFRSLVAAMEARAQALPDVQRSMPEIYRQWSDAVLDELADRFPEGDNKPTDQPEDVRGTESLT